MPLLWGHSVYAALALVQRLKELSVVGAATRQVSVRVITAFRAWLHHASPRKDEIWDTWPSLGIRA